MEDIRRLIADHEAEAAPESLAYHLRGLTAVMLNLVQDGAPSDIASRLRYLESLHAVAHCVKQYATWLARWHSLHDGQERDII